MMRPSTASVVLSAVLALLLLPQTAVAAKKDAPARKPDWKDYLQRAEQAARSDKPEFLEVAQVDDNGIEAAYQQLSAAIDRPMQVWQLVLLDYPRLRLLRNRIYARYGRSFSSEDLDAYFRAFVWYRPDPAFSESRLTAVDRENISRITRLEYLKFHEHQHFGQVVAFTETSSGNEFVHTREKATNVPGIDGTITREFSGCCGVVEGSTTLTTGRGAQFYSSFGSETDGNGYADYIVPLWGKNLVAWINSENRGRQADGGDPQHDRIAVLGASGKPVIDISLPNGSLPMHYHFNSMGMTQFVLVAPDVLYCLEVNAYNPENTRQYLLFTKKKIPFAPQVGELFRWQGLENSDTRAAVKDPAFAQVRNPEVLWSRKAGKSGTEIFLFGLDRIYFITTAEKSPDIFTVVDKLTGRELLTYRLPVKPMRYGPFAAFAVTDDTLIVYAGPALHFLDLQTGHVFMSLKMEDLARRLNMPLDRFINWETTGVVAYNSVVLYGKSLYEANGEDLYLLAFDPKANLLWTHAAHVTDSGRHDRNKRFRYFEFLGDSVCFLTEQGCYLLDIATGRPVAGRTIDVSELEQDLSGKGQNYPSAVWQDKMKGDNYFTPNILHVDNNYLFVKGTERYWALGEQALYDHLRRTKKLDASKTKK